MPGKVSITSAAPRHTEAAAAKLAPTLAAPSRIYLSGELGGGKTTWTRALLRALGEKGDVPSPTYALAHTYQTPKFAVHHLDLFRERGELTPDLREYVEDDNAVCVLEWPRDESGLPPPDLTLHFGFAKNGGDDARTITMRANNKKARQCLRVYC